MTTEHFVINVDRMREELETALREIRRLKTWREQISAGDLVRASSITGVIPVASGGTGTSGNTFGAVSMVKNNSGATKTQGTVVVRNGDRQFGVTTTARDQTVIGVLDDASTANTVDGRVRQAGYQSLVTVQDAVAVGDFIAASTTSGAASSAGTILVPGVFGVALTAKVGAGAGTIAAWLFPTFYGMDAPIEFSLDGGGSVIGTGVKLDISVPYDLQFTSWRLLADPAGAIVIDIWKDTYANYPPTVADTITGTDKPTITATNAKNENAGPLTNWGSTTATKGETLRINVDSIASITRVNVTLGAKRR